MSPEFMTRLGIRRVRDPGAGDTPPKVGAATIPDRSSAAAGRPMIELDGVTKIYSMGEHEIRALNHINLSITEGEMVAIMGPSGSGKSTMMNILGCLDDPTDGQYRLDGTDVAQRSEKELAIIRNRKIGFVFQSFNLIPRVSAIRNVELPLVYADAKDRGRRAAQAMDQVGLSNRNKHMPSELSGGQQQRVAIARAMITNPVMLLADEPTGNLDTASSAEIMKLLVALNTQGRTIVVITHEDDIAAYASRVIRLSDGNMVADSSTRQIANVSRRIDPPNNPYDSRSNDYPTDRIDPGEYPTEQIRAVQPGIVESDTRGAPYSRP